MAIDPMDEFEFKPITEGLGFHKKAEKIKADVKNSSGLIVQDKLGRTVPGSPPPSSDGRSGLGAESGRSGRGGFDPGDVFRGAELPDLSPAEERFSEPTSGRFQGSSGGSLSNQISKKASTLSELASKLGLSDQPFALRPSASQSISDMIASLPPSLDFVDDKASATAGKEPTGGALGSMKTHSSSTLGQDVETSRPQIFQPLGRNDYSSPTLGGSPAASGSFNGGRSRPVANSASAGSSGSLVGLGSGGLGATIGGVLGANAGHGPVPALAGATLGLNGNLSGGLNGPTAGAFLPAPGSKAGGAMASTLAPTIGAPAGPSSAHASAYRGRLDESFARAFPHAEKSKREGREAGLQAEGDLIPVSSNLVGGLLDGMVSMGLSTILLVAILAITHINLVGLIKSPDTQIMTIVNLGGLFLIVNLMYMLVTRIFAGASLGEWAFDLQMGDDQDRATITYFFQVIWRQLLVSALGFILLPTLSVLFNRDLTCPLTGLQLYRRA